MKGKGDIAAQRRRYREKHPEKVREAQARWRATHREQIAAYRKAYRQAHREEIRMKENERRRARAERRRQDWLVLPGTEEFEAKLKADRAMYASCGRPWFRECQSVDDLLLWLKNAPCERAIYLGFNIDRAVSQWARSGLYFEQKQALAAGHIVTLHRPEARYDLDYIPGKLLRVTRIAAGEKPRRTTWWESSWMGKDPKKLDADLAYAGWRLRSWHGPAAIASVWMREHGMREHLWTMPPFEADDAVSRAYFGGDIRSFRVGVWEEPIQKLDLNSAYAWALSMMPSFQGSWHHSVEGGTSCVLSPWTIYRVSWEIPSDHPLSPVTPFPWRDEKGLVCYPRVGTGWYWSPLVGRAVEAWGNLIQIHEAWTFRPTKPYLRPWAWLEDIYAYRQRVSPSLLADVIKQAMCCCYGKLVQGGGRWENPYEHLAAAGLCTSLVRARMLQLAVNMHARIISSLTDCVWFQSQQHAWLLGTDQTALGALRHTPLGGFASFSPNFYGERPLQYRGEAGWDWHAAGCDQVNWTAQGAEGRRRVLWTPRLCAAQNRWDLLGQEREEVIKLRDRPGEGFSWPGREGSIEWHSYDPARLEEYRATLSHPYRKIDYIEEAQ